MMIKLTKKEVEQACLNWLRAKKEYSSGTEVVTTKNNPVGIDYEMRIVCKHTRGGVECTVTSSKQPPVINQKERVWLKKH